MPERSITDDKRLALSRCRVDPKGSQLAPWIVFKSRFACRTASSRLVRECAGHSGSPAWLGFPVFANATRAPANRSASVCISALLPGDRLSAIVKRCGIRAVDRDRQEGAGLRSSHQKGGALEEGATPGCGHVDDCSPIRCRDLEPGTIYSNVVYSNVG